MRHLFTLFCLLLYNLSLAQDQDHILDLKQKFAYQINPNPDSALYYLDLLNKYCDSTGYAIGLAEGLYLKASYFRRVQDFDSAVYYLQKTIDFSDSINYLKGKAVGYNGLCRTYYRQQKMAEGLEACNSCIPIAIEIGDVSVLADTYIAIGNIHLRANRYTTSLTEFFKVDSMHQLSALRPDIIAAAYQSIGLVYLDLEDYQNAEKYFVLANDQFEQIPGGSYYLYTTQWYLGQVYYHTERYELSDSLLLATHDFFSQIQELRTLAEIDKYLGLIRIDTEKYTEAEKYLLAAHNLHIKFENEYDASFSGLKLAELYLKLNQPQKAISQLNEVTALNRNLRNPSITIEKLKKLSEVHFLMNDPKVAYEYLVRHNNLNDSLIAEENLAKIREIEDKYQAEQKEREIRELENEKVIQSRRIRNQATIGILVIIIAAALAGLYYNRARFQNRINRNLKEVDEVKSRFFANISHEFRTPLTLINGPIENRLENDYLSPEERTDYEMIQRNSGRLLNLVDQLLDLSKLESGNFRIKIRKNENLDSLLKSICDSFHYLAETKSIHYDVIIPDIGNAWFDEDIVEKTVTNLLSNAFKYTNEGGTIQVKAERGTDGYLKMTFQNDSKPLEGLEIEKMFDRFYQTNEQNPGSGIGLALIKELIQLCHGEIKADQSEPGKLKFEVSIPVDASLYTKEELSEDDQQAIKLKIEPTIIEADEPVERKYELQDDLPILLIVEDNSDVRKFINGTMQNDYQIIEAENGEIGIDKALQFVPDLIITDLMMPIKNGVELCEFLKDDERTCHIPIIMLTAKVEEKDMLEGLSTGADDYITKPFKIKLLESRAKNLIENRNKLRNRYSQEIILKPREIAIVPKDEVLLERIQLILDEKITDPGFSVENFSKEVGMSRMQLHRKLKALTGLSATEFIRSQRLKLATDLLKQKDVNISEVGYMVGFNDPSYFSKCFKDAYGHSPTAYLETLSS